MTTSSLLPHAAELIDRNMTIIPFPDKETLVRKAISGFQNFLGEPIYYRSQWTFLLHKGQERIERGYFRRDDDEHKSFFHFAPCLGSMLAEQNIAVRCHYEFYNAAAALFDACEQLMLLFVRALDKVSPGYGLSLIARHPSSREMNTLRLLDYDCAAPSATIANWHTDRSALTMHIDDSRPALRLGREQILHRCIPEAALVFPGDKIVRTFPLVRPVNHAVIEQSNSVIASQEERWSAVFFFHINTVLVSRH
jgi:hypothetical protein